MDVDQPQPDAPQPMVQLESGVLDSSSNQAAQSSHTGWFCLLYFVGAMIGVIPSFALLGWKCHPIYVGEPLRSLIFWLIVTTYVCMAYSKERRRCSREKAKRLGFYCGLLSWFPANLAFYLLILPSGGYTVSWP